MSNNSSGHEKSNVINMLIKYPLDINPVVTLLNLILVFLFFFFLKPYMVLHMATLSYIHHNSVQRFLLSQHSLEYLFSLILLYKKLISKIHKDLKQFNSKKITQLNNGQRI